MGYTEQNLGKNEEIIQKAKISRAVLIPTVIGCIILMVLAVSLDAVTAGIVISAISIIWRLVPMLCTELSLTNKKLLGETGIIITKVVDSPLNKINNISVEQGIFGKIFGYGQIVITTSSGGYNFRCIGHPDTFRSAVMNQIDAFDEERIRKQAEQMANAMKQ